MFPVVLCRYRSVGASTADLLLVELYVRYSWALFSAVVGIRVAFNSLHYVNMMGRIKRPSVSWVCDSSDVINSYC